MAGMRESRIERSWAGTVYDILVVSARTATFISSIVIHSPAQRCPARWSPPPCGDERGRVAVPAVEAPRLGLVRPLPRARIAVGPVDVEQDPESLREAVAAPLELAHDAAGDRREERIEATHLLNERGQVVVAPPLDGGA